MARKKRKRIASRGSVNNIILKVLVNGDKYGYDIIKLVEEESEGKIILKQPSLYSSLSRFEEKGIVNSYWGDSDIGGRRHYYHLTDVGLKYYEKNVLKINTEKETKTTTIPIITNSDKDNIQISESENVIISNNSTGKVDIINVSNENINNEITNISKKNLITEETLNQDNNKENNSIKEKPWEKFSNYVKTNNKKCSNSPNCKFHYEIPKRKQVVIKDKDGIIKLRDIDYNPNSLKSHNKIIDNVKYRRTGFDVFSITKTNNKSKNNVSIINPIVSELTEEERKKRNEEFLAKFNAITQNKIAEKGIFNNQENEIKINNGLRNSNKKSNTEEIIDYRNKLSKVLDEQNKKLSEINLENDDEIVNLNHDEDENFNDLEDNKLFDYSEEKDFNNLNQNEDDKFIDFNPDEFETKTESTNDIQNNDLSPIFDDSIKISPYKTNSNYQTKDKSYVLINKVKFVFGLIMGFLLLFETTLSLILFKKFDYIMKNDNILFIITYILIAILILSYIIPFIFNSSQHKYNNFKYKYAVPLGFLTFIVSIVLTYCINALIGFDLTNINYFVVKLFLPIILSSNFVICPIIYGLLINNKKFYN